MDKTMQKLCEMVDREMEKIANGGSLENSGTRRALDELAHTKKSFLTIEAMESAGGFYDRGNSYGYVHGPMYGGSYAAETPARDYRDNMGMRESRDNMNSYGSGREGMMRHLEDMRRSATSDAERQNIERWMREMNSL